MKAIRTLLLLVLPLLFSGCMTNYCLEQAKGEIYLLDTRIKIISNDGTNCVIQRISSNGATNELHVHMVETNIGYAPKPAYYALVPLTIPPDVVLFPFEFLYAYFHLPVH